MQDRSGVDEKGFTAICSVVLCKVRLVGPWIKRREVVVGVRGS